MSRQVSVMSALTLASYCLREQLWILFLDIQLDGNYYRIFIIFSHMFTIMILSYTYFTYIPASRQEFLTCAV